ncbi:MAG: hypothetical protein Q7W55_11315 [Pseudohongiella sp.]|nr:hypothetical protein [Pseudohongiella sp.]MDO9519603.1 hypothetical protein [Pseudohongiella sp.]MDP2127702.1 hypothetical protein [Pseudohongiella sp.]
MISSILNHEFWLSLEYLPIAEQIGATWLFPLFNSLHVLSVCFMLGALLMLDLRIAGVVARGYTIKQLSDDFLPWIWGAFVVAVATGTALFITRASAHILNAAFQWKLGLMLLAGINMVAFHFYSRNMPQFRARLSDLPIWIRVSGVSSLILWTGATLAGRWMGHIV